MRLSPAAVADRIRKLEARHVITGYHAHLNARSLGLDITAFIGVVINFPRAIDKFEAVVAELPEVLECHHVTGSHTLVLKVRTTNTASLEQIISRLRCVEGVERTETMVVLSTRFERTTLPLGTAAD